MSTLGAAAADSGPTYGRALEAESRCPAKLCRSVVATLCTPSASKTVPAKLTTTPMPRDWGLAANSSAAARLAGPSASSASALRCAPVSTTGAVPEYVSSSHNAVSSMVSVPCSTTIPSVLSRSEACATAPAIRSQSAGVSCELSTASASMTSTSNPAVRSAPDRVGRFTPSASELVEMVPPVAMTTR